MDFFASAVEAVQGAAKAAAVRVDVESAFAALRELDALAAQCRRRAEEAKKLASSLQSCWKGSSGDAVRERLARWVSEEEEIAGKIEAKAAKIRKKVQLLVDTDAALARLIQS